MGTATKILVIILTINVMLYLGGMRAFENDFLSRFVDIDGDTVTVEGTEFGESIPESPYTGGSLNPSGGSFSFIDSLAIAWDIIKLLLNLIVAPIALFVGMPLIVILLLGVPLSIVYGVSIIMLIRGVSNA